MQHVGRAIFIKHCNAYFSNSVIMLFGTHTNISVEITLCRPKNG